MRFLWPSSLFLLGLPLLLLAAYVLIGRRRRRYALRFSSLSLVREALSAQSRLRRYLPPALFLLALVSLVIGLARPVAVTIVPAGRATVMLAMDVSSSMLQNDIPPSRLAAAQGAALSFIARQQANNQIGIVAFASIAQLVQYPSIDGEQLERAVESLTAGRGTAIGSGILTALDTIAEFNQAQTATTSGSGTGARPAPTAEAEFSPDIVVLLTDGLYNVGPDPLEAAQQAADSPVRIYTIGYGTAAGAARRGNSMFRGGFVQGIDERSLQETAAMTGGKYYSADSASQLQKVFASLPTVLVTREETVEISVLFAALGAVLVVSAVLLSRTWHPLP